MADRWTDPPQVRASDGSTHQGEVLERTPFMVQVRWFPPGLQRIRWFSLSSGKERRQAGDSWLNYQPTHRLVPRTPPASGPTPGDTRG